MSVRPDGTGLAAGRDDGTVTIYEVGSGRTILGPLTVFETYQPVTAKSDGHVLTGGKVERQ